MFVDSITLPKFDNASYKLYINGNQMDTRNSKIYVNDKAANISMDITPSGDFFSQSQDMVIDMRNTVNQSGDNKVSVSVEMAANLIRIVMQFQLNIRSRQ